MDSTADVIIMGGGIIGASIAYHLRRDDPGIGRVMVIEQDWTYARAAAPMSMGGIRQQYSAACNVALARYSLPFYEQFDAHMAGAWGIPQAHFHQRGYLVLMHAETKIGSGKIRSATRPRSGDRVAQSRCHSRVPAAFKRR